MTETIGLRTTARSQMVDITREVRAVVSRTGVVDGACLVFAPHTTAGICINENADPDVRSDVERFLERIIPRDAGFEHAEGNSDSHIKAILTGSSVVFPVEGGRLKLGRWQGIYFVEFDGPRSREAWVTTWGRGSAP